MYKAVFQNSKAALAFAAMIIISAVSMVGTSEDGGVVTRAADLIGAQRDAVASEAQAYAESRSGGDQPSKPAKPNVFGDYTPADEAAARQAAAQVVKPQGPPPPGHDLMTAPLAPGAQMGDSAETGEAVITERELTIEPQ